MQPYVRLVLSNCVASPFHGRYAHSLLPHQRALLYIHHLHHPHCLRRNSWHDDPPGFGVTTLTTEPIRLAPGKGVTLDIVGLAGNGVP